MFLLIYCVITKRISEYTYSDHNEKKLTYTICISCHLNLTCTVLSFLIMCTLYFQYGDNLKVHKITHS